MDTTLSINVPGTIIVPYVMYLASNNFIKLRGGLSIFKYDGTSSAYYLRRAIISMYTCNLYI